MQKEHFWDFFLEAREMLKDDKKELLGKYITLKPKEILDYRNIDEDPDSDLNESVCGLVESLIDPEQLRKYNPIKFKYVIKLLKPFRHSVRKLADPEVTIYEKRKTLKKSSSW